MEVITNNENYDGINEKMTSLQISEITGNLNKNVLRDIEKIELVWKEVTGLKFEVSE